MQRINDSKGLGVVAERRIRSGSIVVSAQAQSICRERTSHSIENAAGLHVLMDEPAILINHSCQPTTLPRPNAHGAFDFVATRDIEPGEEITFDYAVTETQIVQPFPCDCKSKECREMVTGRLALVPG